MAEYEVKLLSRAVQDLDRIYKYIAHTLLEKGTALSLVERIESGIFSLGSMPYRCPERKIGAYANRGYRHLLVDNYTIVFRVDEKKKLVVIVTIRYSASQF